MRDVERSALLVVAFTVVLGASGCGDDDGGGSGGSGGTGGDGGDGAAAGGAGGTGGGTAGAGGNPTGCSANPDICPPAMQCCEGNPYPPEGQCFPTCDLDSDRAIKHDVRPVDGEAILETLAAMPVTQWRYDASPGTQHMGPMAQDFHQAFSLGETDRRIATVDANGVSMAAIQALYHRVEALRVQSEGLERENAALRLEVADLRATFR